MSLRSHLCFSALELVQNNTLLSQWYQTIGTEKKRHGWADTNLIAMSKKYYPVLATSDTFFSSMTGSGEKGSICREVFYINERRYARRLVFFINNAVNV
jgi:hypothetical protein